MRRTTAQKYDKSAATRARALKSVPLSKLRVSERAQREFKQYHADHLFRNFNPDDLGVIEVSFRNGLYYIIDGQHRFDALKRWLGEGWQDQHLEVWVADGMSEKEEADAFLRLNDRLATSAYQHFRIALVAEWPEETAINNVVKDANCKVGINAGPLAIAAVGTLKRIYRRDGEVILKQALLACQAFGEGGLSGTVIDAMALVLARYQKTFTLKQAVDALTGFPGGLGAVMTKANVIEKAVGGSRSHCLAAALVDIFNRSLPKSKKLPGWWR